MSKISRQTAGRARSGTLERKAGPDRVLLFL